ncbi:MAG TPA: response regulator [Labilithrix sp.]|nr:response regulator [Labilithrix sp.]
MKSVSVLVVDDDDDIREVIAEILIDSSYTVVTARNGVEALELLEVTIPALIILDLNMPVMDGVAFRRLQQQHPELARIPTIAMSAVYRMQEQIADLGFQHALAKPVELRDLLEVVARYCKTTSSRP